jgi:hypothetical protein
MKAVMPHTDHKRVSSGPSGPEYHQESAKTDGMSKGGSTGAGGSDGGNFALGKRGGAEYTSMTAKVDGMCK